MIFTTGELQYLKDVQETAMQDTCIIQTFSDGSSDALGQTTPVYTDGDPTPCGLHMRTGREENRSGETETRIVETNSTVRLPSATVVTEKDRIKITHRFRIALSVPLVFEIIQKPRLGSSGLLVDVRIIETQ